MKIIKSNSLEHINLEIKEILKSHRLPYLLGSTVGSVHEFVDEKYHKRFWELIDKKTKLQELKYKKYDKKVKRITKIVSYSISILILLAILSIIYF